MEGNVNTRLEDINREDERKIGRKKKNVKQEEIKEKISTRQEQIEEKRNTWDSVWV